MSVRAVFHAHSTWSYDGSWELPAIARAFGRMGADVVMMSEHDTGFDPARFGEYRAACAAASTGTCRLVPGIEYSCPDNDIHILTWGLTEFLGEHRPVAQTLAAVAEAAGAAIFAHPIRRDVWRKFDPAWVPYLSAIEIWNRKSDGLAPGEKATELIARTGLPASVGVDFHRAKQFYPLTNRVEADSEEAALVAAIRAGRFTPMAFGRPLGGAGLHHRLEGLRRGTLRLIRGKKVQGKGRT